MKSKRFPRYIFVVSNLLLLICAFAINANALDYHNCDQCHMLHGAPGGSLTYYVNSETMCMSCHDGSEESAPAVTMHKDDGEEFASCVDCHDTHSNQDNYEGGINTSMVGYLYTPSGGTYAKVMSNHDDAGEYFNVAFEATTREFWRSSPRTDVNNGRRICQVCHTVPTEVNRMPHPPRTDCTASCHTHLNGFMFTGGGGGGGMP